MLSNVFGCYEHIFIQVNELIFSGLSEYSMLPFLYCRHSVLFRYRAGLCTHDVMFRHGAEFCTPDDVTRQLMEILQQSNLKDNSSDSEDNTSTVGQDTPVLQVRIHQYYRLGYTSTIGKDTPVLQVRIHQYYRLGYTSTVGQDTPVLQVRIHQYYRLGYTSTIGQDTHLKDGGKYMDIKFRTMFTAHFINILIFVLKAVGFCSTFDENTSLPIYEKNILLLGNEIFIT